MNFWEAQRQARKRSALFVSLFLFLTVAVAIGLEVVIRLAAGRSYAPLFPWIGLLFLAFTVLVALFQYLIYRSQGGGVVAQSLGGIEVARDSSHPYAHRLYNTVEEMSIASGLPMPKVYILNVHEINAFAAGITPDRCAIAVTKGAIEALSRDELQAVIGHEFGHIANGDTSLNLRLAAMLMGFFIVFYIGIRLIEVSVFTGRRGQNPLAIAAFAFLIAGGITWFCGAILRACVSRQREFLADASSAQYTRNPESLASALQKIGMQTKQDMPKRGLAYSHMYFSHRSTWGKLFATHPPLEKRVEALKR